MSDAARKVEPMTHMKKPISSTESLREFLVGQMTGVADGEVELDRAKGIANISQQIYNTLNIEVKMAEARAKLGDEAIKSVDFT